MNFRRFPGDPDLRTVVIRMDINRPYAESRVVDGDLIDVSVSRDIVVMQAYGYLE